MKWLVRKVEQVTASVDIGRIDYCYEAHSGNWENLFVLEGKVQAIKILYQRYKPDVNNPRVLVPVSGETVKVEQLEGFEEFNDMEASGYIVGLTECLLRPATQGEVTFK